VSNPWEAAGDLRGEAAQNKVKTCPWFVSVHACDRTLFYAARRVVGYDTGPIWKKVRCPVLVIYGDKDASSGLPEPLVAIVRGGLENAYNPDVTVRVFAGADHSLCVTKGGGPKEQARRARNRKDQGDPDFVPDRNSLTDLWTGVADGCFNVRNIRAV
jgi:pimeloyl-ACP methyl ester carboxylesterase